MISELQYCETCKVSISTKTDICPLCHEKLPARQDAKLVETYPDFAPFKRRSRLLALIFSGVCALIIVVCVLVNLLTWNGHLWSALVTAPALYVWICGLITFKKRIHLGLKLMAHAIGIASMLVAINTFSGSAQIVTHASWAVSYSMPFIFIGFILAINVLMIRKRHTLRDYVISQISLCVIGFIPLLLVLLGVAQPIYPSILAAACSALTIGGLFLFGRKNVTAELNRKFHI
ncbi:MAG TPA: DUF6320 domain-containing protein [Clostridia bacterium]|nr:DUF6320 domain-containing protein [Clostridia bacterium]